MERVIKAIKEFVPSCEQEKVDKKLFLACARKFKNVLTRDNELCHFTSSVFVINESKNKVVSIFHNIYKSWSWLGGHVDGDDDFLRVAKKEVEEESGIKNIKVHCNGIYSLESLPVFAHTRKGIFVPAHVHLNVTYVFVADEQDNLRIQEDENSNIAWLGFNEIVEKSTEDFMKPVYQKVINKIGMEK